MESVQTFIEFVSGTAPASEPVATIDPFSLSIVLLVCIFALSCLCFTVFNFATKRSIKNTLSAGSILVNNKLIILFAVYIFLAASFIFASFANFALANKSDNVQASDKVQAFVNPDSGEVTIDAGYLENIGPLDIYVIEVGVDYLDEIEIKEQCM